MKKVDQQQPSDRQRQQSQPYAGQGDSLLADDPLRLLGELQACQLELEAQSQDLQGIQHEIKGALNQYADFYDFAPVGYLTLDNQGTILESNLTAADMLGMERCALLGQPFGSFVAVAARGDFTAWLEEIVVGGSRPLEELAMAREGGRRFAARLEGAAYQDSQGRWQKCRLALIDVAELRQASQALPSTEKLLQQAKQQLEQRVAERTTDLLEHKDELQREARRRRQAEAALSETERRYQSLVETSPDAICAFDREGMVMLGNQQAATLYGSASVEEIIGRHILEFIAPEDHERALADMERLWRGERIDKVEYRFIRKDGSGLYGDVSASAMELTAGQLQAIIVIIRDVTERKLADEALKRSEKKFRSLFESSKDAVFFSDVRGRLRDINHAGVELLGYESKKELLEARRNRGLFLPPREWRSCESSLKELGYIQDYELRLISKDGRRLSVSVTAGSERSAQGEIEGYCGIMRDLTEHRQIEERLFQTEKIESIGRLAGGIAHDLNNILTAVQGYTDLALGGLPPGSPIREDLEESRSSSQRAVDLVRQLLLFSRRGPVDFQPVALTPAVRQMEKMLAHLIGDGYRLSTSLPAELWPISADENHLQQVLMNLVLNARDAMPRGGEIVVSAANRRLTQRGEGLFPEVHPGKYVCLTVSDSGVGIDPRQRAHIFEPFYTTKDFGSGLGLSVVYGIVKQHHGWVEVESEPGQGSRFMLYFPAVDQS